MRAAAFCRPPCIRVFLHRRRLILSATAGQVKVEQHDCSRSPPPYYCFAGGSTVAELAEAAAGSRAGPTAGEEAKGVREARAEAPAAVVKMPINMPPHSGKGGGGKARGSRSRRGKGTGSKGTGGMTHGGKRRGGNPPVSSDWKDRIALDADTTRDPNSAQF